MVELLINYEGRNSKRVVFWLSVFGCHCIGGGGGREK